MPYTNQQVEKIELFCNLRSLKKKYLISLEKLNINKNNCAICGSQMRPHILFLD